MRNSVNVILPDRLYQRANFLTWSHAQKHGMLDRYGISMVVNLWRPLDSDLANDHGFVYLGIHMPGNRVPKDIDTTVAYVAGMMRQGHVVLVHCEAGMNRSAWFCVRLLMELGHFNGEAALRIVQERIPRCEINSVLMENLMAKAA